MRDVVIERVAQVKNWMAKQTPEWHTVTDLYERYLGVTQIYYQVKHGIQQRLASGRPKRNVVNVLVFHPYHNAYRWYHFTYRYPPCATDGMHDLLQRIFTQAAELCTSTALAQAGYHCRCNQDRQPPTAIPADYALDRVNVVMTLVLPQTKDAKDNKEPKQGNCKGHCNTCGRSCNGPEVKSPPRLPQLAVARDGALMETNRPSVTRQEHPNVLAIPDRSVAVESSDSESLPSLYPEEQHWAYAVRSYPMPSPPQASKSTSGEPSNVTVNSADASADSDSDSVLVLAVENQESNATHSDGGSLPSLDSDSDSVLLQAFDSFHNASVSVNPSSKPHVDSDSDVSEVLSVSQSVSQSQTRNGRRNRLTLSGKKRRLQVKDSQATKMPCIAESSERSGAGVSVAGQSHVSVSDRSGLQRDAGHSSQGDAGHSSPIELCSEKDNAGHAQSVSNVVATDCQTKCVGHGSETECKCFPPKNKTVSPVHQTQTGAQEATFNLNSSVLSDSDESDVDGIDDWADLLLDVDWEKPVVSETKQNITLSQLQIALHILNTSFGSVSSNECAKESPEVLVASTPTPTDSPLVYTLPYVIAETSSSSDESDISSPDVTFLSDPEPTPNQECSGKDDTISVSPVALENVNSPSDNSTGAYSGETILYEYTSNTPVDSVTPVPSTYWATPSQAVEAISSEKDSDIDCSGTEIVRPYWAGEDQCTRRKRARKISKRLFSSDESDGYSTDVEN